MFNNYPGAAVVGTLTGLALIVSGCQGDNNIAPDQPRPTVTGPALGEPYPNTLHCVAQSPEKWIPPDARLNAEKIAQSLRVSPDQIHAGKFGGAVCKEAIRADQAGGRATIRGIGSVCLVVGTRAKPVEGKVYSDILAVCAAPYSANSPTASSLS